MTLSIIDRAATAADAAFKKWMEEQYLPLSLGKLGVEDWPRPVIVRAVLEAIREPSEEMAQALLEQWPIEDIQEIWQAMIDAALADPK